MILATILLSILIAVVAIATIISVIVGGSFMVVFGDLIVFGILVWLIIQLFPKKS